MIALLAGLARPRPVKRTFCFPLCLSRFILLGSVHTDGSLYMVKRRLGSLCIMALSVLRCIDLLGLLSQQSIALFYLFDWPSRAGFYGSALSTWGRRKRGPGLWLWISEWPVLGTSQLRNSHQIDTVSNDCPDGYNIGANGGLPIARTSPYHTGSYTLPPTCAH